MSGFRGLTPFQAPGTPALAPAYVLMKELRLRPPVDWEARLIRRDACRAISRSSSTLSRPDCSTSSVAPTPKVRPLAEAGAQAVRRLGSTTATATQGALLLHQAAQPVAVGLVEGDAVQVQYTEGRTLQSIQELANPFVGDGVVGQGEHLEAAAGQCRGQGQGAFVVNVVALQIELFQVALAL